MKTSCHGGMVSEESSLRSVRAPTDPAVLGSACRRLVVALSDQDTLARPLRHREEKEPDPMPAQKS
jgi:hypothetical protein